EPLTIVHISDLHADRYTTSEKLNRYVEVINKQNPDLVVFGGDLISSGTEYVQAGAAALAAIEARYGVFAVMGDHDYWSDTEYIINQMKENGVTVLLDENYQINHGASSINLTGVTELYSQSIPRDSLDTLLDEFYEDEESLKALISHQASDR